MKRIALFLIASAMFGQTDPSGAFLGVFKQGSGPVSSTVGGFAGTTFKASEALGGISGFGGGYWTKSGSSVLAGVLKRMGSVGDFTGYCTASAGLASEVTTGLAGSAGCLATFPLAKLPRFGASLDRILPHGELFGGAAVFSANVTGYDFGGRRVIPGFGIRFPFGR